MSTWVPEDEYKQIKSSWRSAAEQKARRFDYGTAQQNLDRCHENLRQLAAEMTELQELHERLPIGDTRRMAHKDGQGNDVPSLEERFRKNKLERAHWREYVSHYQRLAAQEPAPRRPTDPLPQDSWVGQRERVPGEDDAELTTAAPLGPDPRLPREEDPDDIGTGAP